MVSERTVFDDGNYRVVYGDCQSDSPVVYVVTDNIKGTPSRFSHSFAEAFFAKKGFNYIALKTDKNDWYLGDCDAAIQAVMGLYQGRRAIGYGSSMGAYALLNYFHDLDLSHIVAFCPQFSIDRSKVPFETRWEDEAAQVSFERDKLGKSLRIPSGQIIVDRTPQDRNHVRLIADSHNIEVAWLNFTGHLPAAFLNEAGVIDELMTDVLTKHIPASEIRRRIRKARPHSASYMLEVSLRLYARGDFQGAIRAAEIALVANGGNSFRAQAHFANLSLQGGDPARGLRLMLPWMKDSAFGRYAQEWVERCGNALLRQMDDRTGAVAQSACCRH